MLRTPPTPQTEYWKPHEEFSSADVRFPVTIKREETRHYVNYNYYETVDEQLGHGSFGATYKVVQVDVRNPGATDFTKPTHILKHYFTSTPEMAEQALLHAKREFYTSKMLTRLRLRHPDYPLGSPFFCEEIAVCAEDLVFDLTPTREYPNGFIYTLFPFKNAFNLHQFMYEVLYPSFEPQPMNFKRQVVNISWNLCETVRLLNAAEIYHNDIKAENIIVSGEYPGGGTAPIVTMLRFIDFGETCIGATTLDYLRRRDDPDDMNPSLQCNVPNRETRYSYRGSRAYRDPAADDIYEIVDVDKLWPLFEMYSCAVVMQHLIDPQFKFRRPISFLPTSGSPPGFSELITQMTAPLKRNSRGFLVTSVRPSWDLVVSKLARIQQSLA